MKHLALLIYLSLICALQAGTARYRIVWQESPHAEATIVWEQQSGETPVVHYGLLDHGQDHAAYTNAAPATRSELFRGMVNTSVELTGLQPDSNYYFVIKDSDSTSERFYFRTAPNTKKPFKFIQGGDSRSGTSIRKRGNRMVAKLRPLFVSFGGDLIASGSDEQWMAWLDHWQLTIPDDGRITPISPVRGNHESADEIPGIFHIDEPLSFYKVVISDGLFCQYELNSNISASGTQKTWLEADLAANAHKYTFLSASYHKPMRPHQKSKSEGNGFYNNLADTFWQYRFSLLAENDSHCVKRTKRVRPDNGPGSDEGFIEDPEGYVFIGEGTWGAPKYSGGGWNDNKTWTLDASKFNGFDLVHVYNDHMEIRTIKFDNVDDVGSLTDLDELAALPENIDIWQARGGEVQYIAGPGVGIDALALDQQFLGTTTVLAASAPNDASVTKIDFYINNKIVGADANGTGGWSIDWNSPDLGRYTYHIVATHPDGSTTRSQNVPFEVYLYGASMLAFDYGSDWNYYDQAEAPGADWYTESYDDSSWASGNGDFGISRGNTRVQNSGATCYFRKTFDLLSVTNLSITDLNFSHDDGLIIYVNGTQVARTNLPDAVEGEDLHTLTATQSGEVSTLYQISPLYLKPGKNIIAVSIHNSSATPNDIRFDAGISSNQFNMGDAAILDPDSDGDGLPDRKDQFPDDPERTYPLNDDPTLLVHYNFNNLSGGIATDSSDNQLDATLVDLDPAQASVNNAVDFSSADGYVRTPVIPGEFQTIFFRYKSDRPLVGDAASEVLMTFGLNANDRYIWQGSSTGGLTNEVFTLANNGATAHTTPLDELWHHCAYIWNGSTYDFYLDGTKLGTVQNGGTNPADLISQQGIEIGARTSSGDFSNDLIDELRIYGRPLSKTDINEIIDTTHGKTTYTVIFNAGTHGAITAGEGIQNLTLGADAVPPTITVNSEGRFAGWDSSYTNITGATTLNAIYSFEADVYVDASLATSGDGSSWGQAYNSLADALTNARTGNTLHVAAGIYIVPSAGLDVPNAVTILGGYPEGGGARDSRANPTVVSGDLNGNGSAYAKSLLNITAAVDIDGLTFTKTVNTSGDIDTAAIAFLAGSQGSVLRNSIIIKNAHKYSSAIALQTGAEYKETPVVFESCLIKDNGDAAGLGSHASHGAILMYAAGGIHFNNCTFTSNTADSGSFYHGGTNGLLKVVLNSCTWSNSGANELINRNGSSGTATFIFLNSLIDTEGVLAGKSMSPDSLVFNSIFSGPGTGVGFSYNLAATSTDPLLNGLVDNGGPSDTFLPMEGSPAISAGITVLQDGPQGPLYYESIYGDSSSAKSLADNSDYTPLAARLIFTPIIDANGFSRIQGFGSFTAGAAGTEGLPVYTTTFEAGSGGELTGETTQYLVANASSNPVTANANSGYLFENWTDAIGAEVGTNNVLIISNPGSAETYTANFVIDLDEDLSLLAEYLFDETAGINAADTANGSYPATLSNADDSAWVDGANGNAFSAANGNAHVSTPAINGGLHTLALRFYTDRELTGSSTGEPLMGFGPNGSSRFLWQGAAVSGISGETITIGGRGATAIKDTISIGWHSLALIWNGSHYDIYLDGSKRTAYAKNGDAHNPLLSDFELFFGRRGSNYSNDVYDTVRVYDRALSEAELNQLYDDSQIMVDTDHDGIADEWETAHFNGLNRDPSNDEDGDGITLEHEYIADTDPTDKNSKFNLQDVSMKTGGTLDITVTGTSSKRIYTLLFSSDMGGDDPWATVPAHTQRQGVDGSMLFRINSATAGFYKVKVELP